MDQNPPDTKAEELSPATGYASAPVQGPCVDVIIAAWNREDTIERAAASALAEPQVHTVFVVDDGSTDKTSARATGADDGSGRLTVLRFLENRGPAAARNAALLAGGAPWLTILDGDDYFLPGRLSKLLGQAQGWDFVADDPLQIPEGRIGIDAPVPMLGRASFEPWQCDLKTYILGNIWSRGRDRKELAFFKPLIRRAFIQTHNLCYDETMRLGEDYSLYARALARGARFLVVQPAGYVAVERPASLSGQHSKQDLERMRDSNLHLAALPQVSPAERRAIGKHYRSLDARVQWLEAIEAVKDRNLPRFLRAWLRSPKAARFVSARLFEQLLLRTSKWIRTLTRGRPAALSGRTFLN